MFYSTRIRVFYTVRELIKSKIKQMNLQKKRAAAKHVMIEKTCSYFATWRLWSVNMSQKILLDQIEVFQFFICNYTTELHQHGSLPHDAQCILCIKRTLNLSYGALCTNVRGQRWHPVHDGAHELQRRACEPQRAGPSTSAIQFVFYGFAPQQPDLTLIKSEIFT